VVTNPFDMTIEQIGKENVPVDELMPMESLRLIVRELLTEELTKSDKKEIEKIARKQAKRVAQQEIERVAGKDLKKTIQKEIEKILKNKATKSEIADISKAVIKKLYQDLAYSKQHVIDQIKV
jgi:hypothetical protein